MLGVLKYPPTCPFVHQHMVSAFSRLRGSPLVRSHWKAVIFIPARNHSIHKDACSITSRSGKLSPCHTHTLALVALSLRPVIYFHHSLTSFSVLLPFFPLSTPHPPIHPPLPSTSPLYRQTHSINAHRKQTCPPLHFAAPDKLLLTRGKILSTASHQNR